MQVLTQVTDRRFCLFIDKTGKAFQVIRSHEIFKQPRIRRHIFSRYLKENITECDPTLQDITFSLAKNGLRLTCADRPCHSSGVYPPSSHSGGSGSSQGQVMWDFWWTKWHWGRFSPKTSHSTDCYTLINYHPGLVQ
jgi:hypothetical protein